MAQMLFLMTTPSSSRHRIRLFESAQQIFRYLACYFLDFNPIEDPRMKKLATSANEAKRVSAATEHTKNSWKSSQHSWNARREQHGYTHGYPEANPHPYPPWVSTHPCGYGYVCGLVGISHRFTHYCHYYHYHLS